MHDKRVKILYDVLDFIISLIRLVYNTRFRTTHKMERKSENCIVMGNGPSLGILLKENENRLNNCDLIAVNFMGLSPEFMRYKPAVYVVCDPAFWLSPEVSESARRSAFDFYYYLVEHVSWEIQLYIPYRAQKVTEIHDILSRNANIQLCYYNKTKVEGFKWFQYMMLKRQWGMFRTETVIIAALLLAIYSDYRLIYLMGTESDWTKNIWVDEQNRLRLTDTHFYGADDRILPEKMHEQCMSLYYTFKSYRDIAEYVKRCTARIYNMNPLSFIDAFEKRDTINA